MKHYLLLLVCLFTSLTNSIQAVNPYAAGDSLFILTRSGLRLREAPNGKIMDILPYGDAVVMLEAQPTTGRVSIEHMNGYWVRVGWNDMEGYVFDAFLSFLPAMGYDESDLLYYCRSNFKLVSDQRSVESDGDSVCHAVFHYRGQKIVYTERFNGPNAELFYSSGNIAFSHSTTEEMFLLFLMLYGHDSDFSDKIRPNRKKYDFPDDGREFGFDDRHVYWNWSH